MSTIVAFFLPGNSIRPESKINNNNSTALLLILDKSFDIRCSYTRNLHLHVTVFANFRSSCLLVRYHANIIWSDKTGDSFNFNVLLFLIDSFGLSSWECIFIIILLYSFTLMTVFLYWANHVGSRFFVCYVAGSILSKDSASEQNLKVMQEKSAILKVIFTFFRVPLFYSLSRFNIFCPNCGKFYR